MQSTFIEALENRQLLSATASPKLSLVAQFKEAFQALRIHPVYIGLFKDPVSGGQVLSESAQFIIRYLDNTNPTIKLKKAAAHPDKKGAVVSTTFALHIIQPAVFSPFPMAYTFTLNKKNPFSLISITKKDSKGDTLKFSATLSANGKKITGVVNIKGPNRSLSDTYSVTASK